MAAAVNSLASILDGKTPVSFLQEVSARRKLTPTYDVLANEGPVHEPVFVMKAQAGEFQGIGKGPSKKKAKHQAASQLLANMFNVKYEELADGDEGQASNTSNAAMNTEVFDGDMNGNPIGELQEYTQKHLLRPPIYNFISEQGPPHAREFVCVVKLAKLQETAVGKSKKVAKRAAASKLLQSVRQIQSDSSSNAVLDDDEEDSLPLTTQMNGTKPNTIPILTAEAGKRANEFYERLRQSDGNALKTIHSVTLNHNGDDYVKMLADLAKERKFDVRYLDIKAQSYSGQRQCLVQIGLSPIAVCHGTGVTIADAKMHAAHNALEYIKVMTAES